MSLAGWGNQKKKKKKKKQDAGKGSDEKRKEKKIGLFVLPIVHRALTIFV